jgi:hypothetical protein
MKRPAAAAAALLAFGAAGISIAAITLAATAVTPFWEGMPLCVATGFLGGLALLLWKPSRTGLVFALAVGFGLGFATYLGMALATLSWWEA